MALMFRDVGHMMSVNICLLSGAFAKVFASWKLVIHCLSNFCDSIFSSWGLPILWTWIGEELFIFSFIWLSLVLGPIKRLYKPLILDWQPSKVATFIAIVVVSCSLNQIL